MPRRRLRNAVAGVWRDSLILLVSGWHDTGNVPDVQVYDPDTDSWDSSNLTGSSLRPLPIGRGGMGKAVYSSGEFFIFGDVRQ